MEVVPEDRSYLIQAQVPVQAIDRMQPGLDVEISFPAFNHAQTPNVPGKVLTVSADRLEDEQSKTPYYLAQIEVTPEGVDAPSNNTIRTGIPASVLIRNADRTMPSH